MWGLWDSGGGVSNVGGSTFVFVCSSSCCSILFFPLSMRLAVFVWLGFSILKILRLAIRKRLRRLMLELPSSLTIGDHQELRISTVLNHDLL